MRTFMQYKQEMVKEYGTTLREGQMFINWLSDENIAKVIDPELFYCRSDMEAWNMINLKYQDYLHLLT